ncbi:MAG: hypothetical protein ACLTF5_08565 [Butyricicoccus sp.]
MEREQIEMLLHAVCQENETIRKAEEYHSAGRPHCGLHFGRKDSALLAVLLRDYQKYGNVPFTICLAMDPV